MEQFLGLPPVASEHGPELDHLTIIVHWLMLVLFVGWGVFYVYTLIRFRRKRNPKADYTGVRGHTSSYLEVAVAIVEAVLLIGFSIPMWSNRVNAFPPEKDALVVRVVGEQFAWNVHYPGRDGVFGRTDVSLVDAENPLGLDREDANAKDDITTINQFNLPVHKPVLIYLSSKDVIHSFGLPYFRVKQDAVPGMMTPVWFTPVKTTVDIRDEVQRAYSLAAVSVPVGESSFRTSVQTYGDAVKSGDLITDEMIEKLKAEGITDVNVLPDFTGSVSMTEYKDKDGSVILQKGDPVTDEAAMKILALGLGEIIAAPEIPTEVACAQLCGLGHYRMRGYMTVQTPEEFESWLAEQESALGIEIPSTEAPVDSAAVMEEQDVQTETSSEGSR